MHLVTFYARQHTAKRVLAIVILSVRLSSVLVYATSIIARCTLIREVAPLPTDAVARPISNSSRLPVVSGIVM